MIYFQSFFKIPWIAHWSYFLDPFVVNDFEWVTNLRRQISVKWSDNINNSFIFQENIKKLYIDDSPPPKEEITVNNLIKNVKAKNLALSKLELRRQLLLALDSKDEEEGVSDQIMSRSPILIL